MTRAVLRLCGWGWLLLAVWSFQGCGSGTSTTTIGPFLYASNSAAPGSMAAFTANASGTVIPVPGSPFPSGGSPMLTIGISGKKFVYGAVPIGTGIPGGIVMFPIQSGVAGSLGAPALQMAASGHDFDGLAVTPSGNFLYAADVATAHVFAFSIDSSTGALKAVGQAAGIPVDPEPFNVRIDPAGKFLFVASCDCSNPTGHGTVGVFTINGDGTLSAVPGSPFSPKTGAEAPHPFDVAVSPDNKFLYIASRADVHTAMDQDRVYSENIAANGALSSAGAPAQLPTLSSSPKSIAVSIDGKFVYTTNFGINTISLLSVGSTMAGTLTGVLTYQSPDLGVPGQPVSLLADPRGNILYATDIQGGRVIVLTIGASGVLTLSGLPVNTGGLGAFGLALFTP